MAEPTIPKPNLRKFPPWVYVMLAAGVMVAVVYMRRQSAPATVPGTDPTAYVPTPDAAVGSFQGYDTPQDNSIQGAQLLDFALATRDQNIAIRDSQVAVREQDLSFLTSLYDRQGAATGGGLPNDAIPNPAPTPVVAAPSNVKKVTNVKPCPKRYPNRDAYGCFKRVCKGKGSNRYEYNYYRNGRKLRVKRCH